MNPETLKKTFATWTLEELIESSMVDTRSFLHIEIRAMLSELENRKISKEEIENIKSGIEKKYSYYSDENNLTVKETTKWGLFFYFIAGLSLINTVSLITKSNWYFPFGLGTTDIFVAFGESLKVIFGKNVVFFMFIMNVILSGIFAIIGKYAYRKSLSAFVTGMILYSLDTIPILFFKNYFSLFIHFLILIFLYQGYKKTVDNDSTMSSIQSL